MSAKFGWRSLWILGLLAAAVALAMAAETTKAPAAAPAIQTIEAVLVEKAPVIDGQLDDACWQGPCCAHDFFRTDKEGAVSEATEAYLCYDKEAVYAAFRCHDSQPQKIHAQERRRDGDIWSDDRVSLMLDPDHDAKNFWEFTVTANGTQGDYIPGGSASKIEWRGDWTAAAQQDSQGWTCEVRVPFKILRYPRGTRAFRIAFTRYLARGNEGDAWPNLGTSFKMENSADWTGLRPPALSLPPLFMPYSITDLGDTPGKRFNAGLDVKYRHPQGLTTLAALNPDYSQIEDAVSSIAFSYQEPWLRETRPFFAEGLQAYYPPTPLFYSRHVGDIDAGVKTFGTLGRTDIGLLEAHKSGVTNTAVAAVGYHYNELSTARFYLVDRQGPQDPHNLVAALHLYDARRTGGDTRWYMWHQEQTYTAGPASDGMDFELVTGHDRAPGHWSDQFQFRRTTAGYFAPLGLTREPGVRGGSAIWTRYDQNLGKLEWRYMEFHNAFFLDDRGQVFKNYHILNLEVGWRNGRSAGIRAVTGEREYADASDISLSYGWGSHDLYRRGGVWGLYGNRLGGKYRDVSVGQGFKLGKKLSASLDCEYARLSPPAPGAYSQYQAILGVTHQFTPEKFATLRFIQRRDGANLFASYRQRMRSGADIYLLIGDPNPTRSVIRKRVALKVIMAM